MFAFNKDYECVGNEADAQYTGNIREIYRMKSVSLVFLSLVLFSREKIKHDALFR